MKYLKLELHKMQAIYSLDSKRLMELEEKDKDTTRTS